MSVEQILARQEELTTSIENAIPNLKKVGVANYTHTIITLRLNAVEKNWKEFCDNHRLLRNLRTADDAEDEYFSKNSYNVVEEQYLLALSQHYTSLETLPVPAAQPGVTATASATIVPARHPRIPQIELPKFSGKLTDWAEFRDLFVSLVSTNADLTNVDRLTHLKTCMIEEASDLLKTLSTIGENFDRAWTILTTRFENKRLVITAHLNEFTALRTVTSESASELKRLIIGTANFREARKRQQQPVGELDDSLIIHLTVQKFDATTRREWETLIGGKTEFPTFNEFETFLNQRINTLEALESMKNSSHPKTQSDSSRDSRKSHHITSSRESVCSLCSANHFIMFCAEFKAKTPEQRRDIVGNKNLCYNCLSLHRVSECRSEKRCLLCSDRHHTLLHTATSTATGGSTSHVTSVSTATLTPRTLPRAFVSQTAATSGSSVLLATALVHVHDHQGKRQLVRALIDQGSEVSLISDSLVKKLKLSRTPASVTINGVGGTHASSAKGRTTLKLSSRVDPRFSRTVDALILPTVTSYQPSIQTVHADWTHLFGVHLADSYEAFQTPIDMLLGADLYAEIIHDGIRRGPAGTPLAQQTALGWILSGPIFYDNRSPSPTAVTSNHCYVTTTDSLQPTSRTAGGTSPPPRPAISSNDEAGGMFAQRALSWRQ